MNKTVLSSYDESDSSLSVTLYSTGFSKDGSMSGKVTRNVVTLENILAAINKQNTGLAPHVIHHSAVLIQQQILEMLRLGKCVNVLDLGLLYIGLKGSVKGGSKNASNIPDFVLRYTPSALANETMKSLQVDKVVISDPTPQIDTVTNVWKHTENTVTPGKTCQIIGDRLKLGGDVYSLSFIPLEEDGSVSITLPPVEIEEDNVFRNTNRYLEFYVPENLDADKKYVIRITTSYVNGTQSRKNSVSVDSNPIAVEI